MISQTVSAAELSLLAPEIIVASTIVLILLAPFVIKSRVNDAVGMLSVFGIVAALMAALRAHASTTAIFGGSITIDGGAAQWRIILLLYMLGILALWFTSTRRLLPAGDAPEFFTLLLTATIGMLLMGEASNLLMVLLATEIASMPSYVLAGFQKHRQHSAEASLKFVLFGAVCTAVMIYGMSLLYGSCGSLDLAVIADQIRASNLISVTAVGLLLLLVGLLFKTSAVPLHFWSPDVYAGAPIDVVAFLSVASKGAGLVLVLRIATAIAQTSAASAAAVAGVLGAVAVVTTTLGTLGALRQTSVRRLLAYSSIAHAGYILSAMACLQAGRSAVFVYIVIYAVMNLGTFAVLADVENETGSDDISAFNGLFARSPISALALVVCLISMVGLPPAAGFFAKWKVLAALTNGGGWNWVLAGSVAINSIVSLVFYVRLLRASYFAQSQRVSTAPRSFAGLLAGACAVGLVVMFVLFGLLDRWANRF